MSDQEFYDEQYADEYVPGDGEAAEGWEQYEADYEPTEGDLLRAEVAELRAEMQNAPQYYEFEPIDTSEEDAARHFQNEIVSLRNMLGRDINPTEAANMKLLSEQFPSASPSMIDAFEAQAQLPRTERWHNAFDAQKGDEIFVENYVGGPQEWSDDPHERALQRQAYIRANQLKQQGYEDAE